MSLVLLSLSVAGLWLSYGSGRGLYLARTSMSWPEAKGRVVSSADGKKYRMEDSSRMGQKAGTVSYRYAVDGVEYTGSRASYLKDYVPRDASKVYPKGSTIAVRYKPDDPTESVLRPGGKAAGAGLVFYLWVGLFSLVIFGSCFVDGVKVGMLRGIISCGTTSVVEPEGLSARIDGFGDVVITIPKTLHPCLFYIRCFSFTWLMMFLLWVVSDGKFLLLWAGLASAGAVCLCALIRQRAAPRLVVEIGYNAVRCVTAAGKKSMNASAWLSNDITMPVKTLSEVVCDGRTIAVSDGERFSFNNVVKGTGLQSGVMLWLSALLQLLNDRHAALESTDESDSGELSEIDAEDGDGLSVLRKYGFLGTKDLLVQVHLRGYRDE